MHRIPNILTIIRMVLTPIWWVLLGLALYRPTTSHFWWAFIMLTGLAISDKADGWFAKRDGGKWRSEWGATWDPLADKALFWSSMVIINCWMFQQATTMDTVHGLILAASCCMLVFGLTVRHFQLDYLSTKLRHHDGQGAKQLGQLKFMMDLLALALALLSAWSIERNSNNIFIAYFMIAVSLGLAVSLATINISNRRSAL